MSWLSVHPRSRICNFICAWPLDADSLDSDEGGGFSEDAEDERPNTSGAARSHGPGSVTGGRAMSIASSYWRPERSDRKMVRYLWGSVPHKDQGMGSRSWGALASDKTKQHQHSCCGKYTMHNPSQSKIWKIERSLCFVCTNVGLTHCLRSHASFASTTTLRSNR